MDAKIAAGSAWGVPVRGAIININDADASKILASASGLATALVKGGGLLIGLAIVAAFLNMKSIVNIIPISSMANIRSSGRNFKGVCITEYLEMITEDQHLTVPTEFIRKIDAGGFTYSKGKTHIELIDGSRYSYVTIKNPNLEFLGLAGKQTANICNQYVSVEGHTIQELRALRDQLVFALENNMDSVINTIGSKVFERYFYRG